MAVWLAMWAVDRLRRCERRTEAARDTRPLLLGATEGQRHVVRACCERALSGGVSVGMPLAQARALFAVGGVRIEAHEPDRDRAALRALALWAQRFSPLVAMDEPDGLLIDVTGCEGVFHGEDRLVAQAIEGLGRLGVRARTAIAPTFVCAWAVSRYGDRSPAVIASGKQREAMAPLSIAALQVDGDVVSGLAEVGIINIGQLLELPRSTLPPRFGDGLLLQLDRALGQGMETIEVVRHRAPPRVERLFDGPTDRVEAVEHTVRELLDELGHVLKERECGATCLEVELERSDLPAELLTIRLGRASRDTRHLWTLLRPKLERAHYGFGVTAVRARVTSLGPLRHQQMEHLDDARHASTEEMERASGELLDTLSNRLGAARVMRVSVRDSHVPERAFVLQGQGAETARGTVRATPNDRPTLLFDHPFTAEVVSLTPDGPVHRVRWKGGESEITSCLGPERIESVWWEPGRRWTRDYFAARDASGRWLWLCRELRADSERWLVHGVWA